MIEQKNRLDYIDRAKGVLIIGGPAGHFRFRYNAALGGSDYAGGGSRSGAADHLYHQALAALPGRKALPEARGRRLN